MSLAIFIDETDLHILIESGEYQVLHKMLKNKDPNRLTPLEKRAWIETQARLESAEAAVILMNHYRLNNPQLESFIYYLAGQNEKSLQIAETHNLPIEQAKALISLGRYDEAVTALQKAPITADWYYWFGNAYWHQTQHALSASCFQSAAQEYEKQGKSAQHLRALSSLATQYHSLGDFEKSRKIFYEIESRIDDFKRSQFPILKSEVQLNLGFFYLIEGRFKKALHHLSRAHRTLQKFKTSSDCYRSHLFLAYSYLCQGYYKKAIALLESFSPIKSYQLFDRQRYLANCYAELGQIQLAQNALQKAKEALSSSDTWGEIYLRADAAQIQFKNGETHAAIQNLNESIFQAEKTQDREALHYCQSHLAWMTRNESLAQQSLLYHQHSGLIYDADRDRLTLAITFIQDKKYEGALAILNQLTDDSSATRKIWGLLLKGSIYGKLNLSVLAVSSYEEALRLSRLRDVSGLTYLITNELLKLNTDVDSVLDILSIRSRSLGNLSGKEKAYYDSLSQELQLNDAFPTFSITTASSKKNYSISDLGPILLSKRHVCFWVDKELIIKNGQSIKEFIKKPSLRKALTKLAFHPFQGVSKEELAKSLTQRTSYNPLSDDNLIYVTLNRLRKLLGSTDLIEAMDNQKYRLASSNSLYIIKQV